MNPYIEMLIPFVGYGIVYILIGHSLLFAAFGGTWRQWLVQTAGGLLCCAVGIVAYILGYNAIFIVLPYLGAGYIVCALFLDWPSFDRFDNCAGDVAAEPDVLYEKEAEIPQPPQLYVAVDNT